MPSEAHDHNTRLRNSFDGHVLSHKSSFVYSGSVLWNSLHHEVKLADNVNTFKCMYKDMILVPSQSWLMQLNDYLSCMIEVLFQYNEKRIFSDFTHFIMCCLVVISR